MVVWNVISIIGRAWPMLGFGILHDAVGVFLIILVGWSFFGKEELKSDKDDFVRIKKLFGFSREKRYPLEKVEDIVFSIPRKNRSNPSLHLVVGSSRRRIASNAKVEELRWLRTELLKFFEPRWK